jgi:SAM-dependent methyltransferase
VNRGSFREFEHEGWEQLPERYHDAFHTLTTQAIGPLLDAVSASGKKLLDVASGPGYVAAAATQRGATVTGVDFAAAMVAEATRRYPGVRFQEGDAEALPFPDASFPLVVAYNVLMDVADMPAAVAEAARVLEPGGRLCACVTHPFADAGRWAGDGDDAPFVVESGYLGARPFRDSMERAGLTMTFDGTAYPLEDYARALEAAGLAIEALREPAPAAGAEQVPEAGGWARWRRIPMFLMLRAVKPAV